MMKKILLLCSAVVAFQFPGQSQEIKDTLTYFFKKQKYKDPGQTTQVYPKFKAPAGTIINTGFTHVGSVFKNRSLVVVNGLEARVMRTPFVVAANGNVPTRLYLANVNQQGLPVFPLLDSTNLLTTSVTEFVAQQNNVPSQVIGGPLAHGSKTVTGNFAVLVRNVSLQEGDTVIVLRTRGHHAASTTTNTAIKFGEGLGVVRYNFNFSKTTDFNSDPTGYFGPGTDYEFCVAPRVTYTLDISQNSNLIQYGACCYQAFTNTNTSHSAWTSPQFNFTQFNRQLAPFNSNMPNVGQDTALVWNLGDGSPSTFPMYNTDDVVLCACGGQCNQIHYDGVIRGNFKKIAPENPVTVWQDSIFFMSSLVWCNDTAGTGFNELGNLANIKIYPNPVVDKTIISGLKGTTSIQVYSMFGQLMLTQEVKLEDETSIDMSRFANGNYLIRLRDEQNHVRTEKIIKQ